MTAAELSPDYPDEYYRSVEQLFGLLGDDQDPLAPQRYYAVDWNEAEPTKIDEVTTMAAEPTGARRQERFGRFYSAQFSITETTGSGDVSHRFIWCSTGPRQTGTPIEPDLSALFEGYDYRQLTTDNIIQTLSERARSVDDYITLSRIMQQRGAQPVPSLLADVNKLLFRFASSAGISPDGPLREMFDQDKMFELILTFQEFGAEIPRTTQGYLVSQLLRTISRDRFAVTPSGTANRAASILKEAISQGVIPDDRKLMDRVFANSSVYGYPFATELLHDKLTATPNYGTPDYIFGIKRLSFVAEYITSVVAARNPGLKPNLDSNLRDSYLRTFESRTEDQPYFLLRGLAALVDKPGSYRSPTPAANHLKDVGKAFAHILSVVHNGPHKRTGAQFALDAKCVEVVEFVLAPIITRKIGKQALVQGEEAEQ